MSKLSRIIITIVTIFLFVILFAIAVGVKSDQGKTVGIPGLILMFTLVGAMKVIWKKNTHSSDTHKGSKILDNINRSVVSHLEMINVLLDICVIFIVASVVGTILLLLI